MDVTAAHLVDPSGGVHLGFRLGDPSALKMGLVASGWVWLGKVGSGVLACSCWVRAGGSGVRDAAQLRARFAPHTLDAVVSAQIWKGLRALTYINYSSFSSSCASGS